MKRLEFLESETIELIDSVGESDEFCQGHIVPKGHSVLARTQLSDLILSNDEGEAVLLSEDIENRLCVIDTDSGRFSQELSSISELVTTSEANSRLLKLINKKKRLLKKRLSNEIYQSFWEDFLQSLVEQIEDEIELANCYDSRDEVVNMLRITLSDYPGIMVGKDSLRDDGLAVAGVVNKEEAQEIADRIATMNLNIPVRLINEG